MFCIWCLVYFSFIPCQCNFNMFMICCPAFHVAVDAIVICNVHLQFNLVAILVRCFCTVQPLLQDHLQNQVTQRSLTTLSLHPLSSNRNEGGGGGGCHQEFMEMILLQQHTIPEFTCA